MFGNNGEYEYCLWSFARIVLCSATTVSMNIAFGLSRAEVRGAERRKQPKAARQEGSLVRCHFDHCYLVVLCHFDRSAEVRGAKWRNLLYTEKRFLDCAARERPKASEIHANVAARKTTRAPLEMTLICYYLFGCNAIPPPQPTHGIRQAFGLHTAFVKHLVCTRHSPSLWLALRLRQAFGLPPQSNPRTRCANINARKKRRNPRRL